MFYSLIQADHLKSYILKTVTHSMCVGQRKIVASLGKSKSSLDQHFKAMAKGTYEIGIQVNLFMTELPVIPLF